VSELESLTHLTSTLFVARFPEDIDPGSALNPANWSIIGNDSSPLPIDNILPAYPPFSWRDFFVQTRRPTDQEYSLTVSGLTDPEGNPLDPFTHSWIPLQPPTEYPTDGIMNPSLDGRYYGSRVEIAIFRYPEWVTNVLGIDSDQNEYPFTQDPNDSRYWSFDTSQLPGPDEGFRVQPVPAEGHEEDFTEDELAIITIPLLPSPFPPWMREVMLSNQTRPGASTFYPTDTIVPTAFVHADRIRGMKVMIARLPFDPSILLPYYPPGANDPNDPNYDPEAPEDGSGNPDWWSLPPRPDFPLYPWSPDAPPPWMPRPMSAAASPWEDQVMPAYPPDIGKDDMWQIELPSFKPIDHDLGPGSYDLIVEVYDYENRKSDYILPFVIDYGAIIDWFRYYGEDITIRDVQDPNVIGWKLKHDGNEWDFTEDPENPGTWKIPSTVLPEPQPGSPLVPKVLPSYPPDFAGDMLPEVEIGVHALPEDFPLINLLGCANRGKRGLDFGYAQKLKAFASIADLADIQAALFFLEQLDGQGNVIGTLPLGEATDKDEETDQYVIEKYLNYVPSGDYRLAGGARRADGSEATPSNPQGNVDEVKGPGLSVDAESLKTDWDSNEQEFPNSTHRKYYDAYERTRDADVQNKYNGVIQRAADEAGVNAAILKATVAVENGFENDPEGWIVGLAQVSKKHPKWKKLFGDYPKYDDTEDDPAIGNQNLRMGAEVLKEMHNYWENQGVTDIDEQEKLASISYNAGQETIRRAREYTEPDDPSSREDGYSKTGFKKACGEVFKDTKDKPKEIWNHYAKLWGGKSYDENSDYPGYLGEDEGQLDPRKHDPET